MIEQLTHNWLCWVIFFLALFCYQQLFLEYFVRRSLSSLQSEPAPQYQGQDSNVDQQISLVEQREFSGVLIGALPLLGLLGTIIGLLECFAGIAAEGASSELVSGGIGDALLTTELGLVCAIPAWLLQSWVQASARKSIHAINPEMAR